MIQHLPECVAKSLAELYPSEPKPDHVSDYSWTEVKIEMCAPSCPVMARVVERGRELAEAYGW